MLNSMHAILNAEIDQLRHIRGWFSGREFEQLTPNRVGYTGPGLSEIGFVDSL